MFPEENLDSLSTNYFDSLNYQHGNLDFRHKNPYAIPANLNHKLIPEYLDNTPSYIPPRSNIENEDRPTKQSKPKPTVYNKQSQKQNLAFTIDFGKKPSSKVFDRLFPNAEKEDNPPPKIPPRNFHLNLNEKPQPKTAKPNARSIFKNYKSCPVSPVSEECKWGDKVTQSQSQNKPQESVIDAKKRNSLSFFVGLDSKIKDSRNIVDTIKSDTEKMIAEITKKYGDLDEFEPNNRDDLDLQPTREVVEKDDGNFSSDSLEDCSLSLDASCKNKLYSKKICKKHNKAKSMPRRAVSNYEIHKSYHDKPVVPVKPSCISQKSSTLPRNMPSNLEDIMDEDINSNNAMYRCQSVLTKRCITRSNESVLSDHSNCSSVSNEIFFKYGNEASFQQAKFTDSRYNLNDSQNCSFENLNEPDQRYLENHRHSSASFFLNQKKFMKSSCSQESMLSDEYLDNENQLSRTNCNSLESILSDDSECTRSAPLEKLFEGAKPFRHKNNPIAVPSSKSCYEFDNSSKSYGSSPNNAPCLTGYMYNNYFCEGSSPRNKYKEATPTIANPKASVHKVYGFEIPKEEFSGHKTVTRSKSLYDSSTKQPPAAKNIAYYFDGNNIQQYAYDKKKTDEIPRLGKADYMANTSKSLQPQFADKHKYMSTMEGCDQSSMTKSRSCSFEVVLEPASKPLKTLTEKRNSHVKRNLEKFEEQIKKGNQSKTSKNQLNKEKASNSKYNNATKSLERDSSQKNSNAKTTMEFVPHKPPKPIKRTPSVKMNNRVKAGLDKSALSSSISSQYKAKLDGLQNKNYISSKKHEDKNSNIEDPADNAEKTFDVFVKEKDVNENRSEMQMDSLEVYAMQRMENNNYVSMDSLDVIADDSHDFAQDSLDYYAERDNKYYGKITVKNKEQTNTKLSKNEFDCMSPSYSGENSDAKENVAPETSDEVMKYKYIERKLEIINKLVEMEERKILQEKIFKEWRMRPLKANINDGKGVVKVLSRKFEKLATKQNTVPNFASLTLEEVDTDTEITENKEIKRNLSLPDILDSDQIGLTAEDVDVSNDAANENAEEPDSENNIRLNNTLQNIVRPQKSLPQRVYNEMIIPKTDVHLDSENYESSTTSSSCNNSPKRMTFYGFNRPKTPFRKIIRHPTPRLCVENQALQGRIRPMLSGNAVRGLLKKIPITPVLPSKFTPSTGWVAC